MKPREDGGKSKMQSAYLKIILTKSGEKFSKIVNFPNKRC